MGETTFTEQNLRQAIVNTWGPAGAHVDVFDTLILRLATARARIESLGFRWVDGDYVLKDGSRSTYFLKPVDAKKLIELALKALTRPASPTSQEPSGDN